MITSKVRVLSIMLAIAIVFFSNDFNVFAGNKCVSRESVNKIEISAAISKLADERQEYEVDDEGKEWIKKPTIEDTVCADGTKGTVTWSIDVNGKLTIKGKGDIKRVKFCVEQKYSKPMEGEFFPWFEYREYITDAKVELSDFKDASYMFYYCGKLLNVDFSVTDTSKVTDMSHMFDMISYNFDDYEKGTSLTKIKLGEKFSTEKVNDMSYMFAGCSNLKDLDVSNFDTSNVTNMTYFFFNCKLIPSLDMSKFNTSKVTDMSYMFAGCSSIKCLDVSNFDTNNVVNMEYMFYSLAYIRDKEEYQSYLEQIKLGDNFKTGKVTNMSHMFGGCNSLKELDVSSFDTSKVTNMESLFSGCHILESLDVSGFDTSKVTNLSDMFEDCYSLVNIDVSNFNTSNAEFLRGMFENCSSLELLDLSSFDTTKAAKGMDSMFYTSDNDIGSSLKEIKFGEKFDISKIIIGERTAYDLRHLTSLDLGKVDVSDEKNRDVVFFFLDSCLGLEELEAPLHLSECYKFTSGEWYLSDGTKIDELPMKLEKSVKLINKKPDKHKFFMMNQFYKGVYWGLYSLGKG